MGSILCCLSGGDDREESGAPPPPPPSGHGCFCVPWPFFSNNQCSTSRQRGDTRVAPDQERTPMVCSASQQDDSMDTFRCPPRPLAYDDPRFIHHPGHDKASTQFQKSCELGETMNVDTGSDCTDEKIEGSSVKQQSGGPKVGGARVIVSSDDENDCPVCLEEYEFENPKITLQCNHNFHLSCIYEWMERSEACPVCAKVMLFNENM